MTDLEHISISLESDSRPLTCIPVFSAVLHSGPIESKVPGLIIHIHNSRT